MGVHGKPIWLPDYILVRVDVNTLTKMANNKIARKKSSHVKTLRGHHSLKMASAILNDLTGL